MPRPNLKTASLDARRANIAESSKATLAGGCFWCTQAIFKRLKGVTYVTSGYSGGSKPNPTYEEICSGQTGHAEAIQIQFNPKVISFEKILEVFFKLHDPTTLNRQGADIGTQYRSVIFYHDQKQKETAKKVREQVDKSGDYADKIVTEIVPFTTFYKAEPNHQNFYENNKSQPLGPQFARTASSAYCQVVIDPKLKKLYKNFRGIVENENV